MESKVDLSEFMAFHQSARPEPSPSLKSVWNKHAGLTKRG